MPQANRGPQRQRSSSFPSRASCEIKWHRRYQPWRCAQRTLLSRANRNAVSLVILFVARSEPPMTRTAPVPTSGPFHGRPGAGGVSRGDPGRSSVLTAGGWSLSSRVVANKTCSAKSGSSITRQTSYPLTDNLASSPGSSERIPERGQGGSPANTTVNYLTGRPNRPAAGAAMRFRGVPPSSIVKYRAESSMPNVAILFGSQP